MFFLFARFIGFILIIGATFLPSFAAVSISANDATTSISARKNILSSVIHSQSFNFSYQALSIFIDTLLVEPRGKMQGNLITLSSRVSRDSEFLKLFVHELGHFIDVYVLRSAQDSPDPSREFYDISWKTATVKKTTETLSSFVSGYALTNQYEDFAESLVLYVFHNRTFEDRALRNESLRQKYLFFQKYLFVHGAFTDTDFTI